MKRASGKPINIGRCHAIEHEAWNRGKDERVVLLTDFRNAELRWRLLNPAFAPELCESIGQTWKELTVKEKMLFYAWSGVNLRRQNQTKPNRQVINLKPAVALQKQAKLTKSDWFPCYHRLRIVSDARLPAEFSSRTIQVFFFALHLPASQLPR